MKGQNGRYITVTQFLPGSGFLNFSGSGFQISPDPDPDLVCLEELDPDPVNIRPDPQPW